MTNKSILSVESVCKEFRRQPVLTDISFEVPEKAITAILGPSGEGKTTLLRLIAGFDRPTSGTLALHGKVVSSVDVHLPPEQRGVGIVPQDGALFPHLTVEENIAFGLPRNQHARVDEMLTLIGMTSQRNSRPAQLSGGQQQRVSLARALAPSPELILLDEPFSALDANMRSTMHDEVTAIIRKTESTAIIVTHDQEEAMSISDKVVVLLNGTVAQFGSPQEIYENPRSSHVARFIGDANLLSAIVDKGRAFHAIGSSPCSSSAQRVIALVRPEHIRLAHDPQHGHAGVVESRSYFGHDGTLEIRLATGEIVTARLPISELADIGSTVFVASIDTATILEN